MARSDVTGTRMGGCSWIRITRLDSYPAPIPEKC